MPRDLIALLLISITASACAEETGSSRITDNNSAATPGVEARERSLWDHICGASSSRQKYCPTDFSRLAVAPDSASGKTISITGFLAVDDSQVVVYASEMDFEEYNYGRSIRVLGELSELVTLIDRFGYRRVRISGEFSSNDYLDDSSDRLGAIREPLKIAPVRERLNRQGSEGIRVPLGELD